MGATSKAPWALIGLGLCLGCSKKETEITGDLTLPMTFTSGDISTTLTFGLGARDWIDTVEIVWPDGERQRLEGATLAEAVDHELLIRRGGVETRLRLEPTTMAPPRRAP